MKIDSWTLGVTVMTAAWLMACGAEATEPTESSTSELGSSCVGDIEAPVGSAAWRAELDACIAKATQQPAKQGSGKGQSCRTGTQCINGACKCTDGPRAGDSCDGSTKTGASSCSVRCKVCD